MRLTLLKAKEALKPKAPADKLEWRINRLIERLFGHGKFQGSIVRVAIMVRYGQLTLPRWLRTVEGIKVDCKARQMANKWFEFMPGRCSLDGYCLDLVRDLGDGHPIMADLPAGGNLVSVILPLVLSGTHILTVTGRDVNGLPFQAPISANQTIPNPFATIERVHKEKTTASITLKHVAANLTETILAVTEPAEEETFYRRYSVDGKASVAETTIEAICKRRHIEFTSDQDILPISNLSALELGLDALQYEAEGDHTMADKYLLKAVIILNQELAETNSDNDIPTIRFRHIGGAPNFYHGY